MNALSRCVELAGGPVALTRELNKRLPRPVTYQAVMKWVRQGRLPRTEWTGETDYARALSEAVGGQVSRDALRERQGHPPQGLAETAEGRAPAASLRAA
jgi:hypothetical protein